MLIILVSSMLFETAWINSQLISPRHIPLGKFTAIQGELYDSPVLIFPLGVGKTNAAHGATLLLEKFAPNLMLLIGCGGAYQKSGLVPGDLTMADEEIFGDEGVITTQGWRSMSFLKLPLLCKGNQTYYNSFKIDRNNLNRAKKILRKFSTKIGAFITVSEISGTRQKAEEMEKRFHGVCENMEGAAVAQLCTLYNVPFLEIRGISNLVKERRKEEWDLSAATRISQEAALQIIALWRENQ